MIPDEARREELKAWTGWACSWQPTAEEVHGLLDAADRLEAVEADAATMRARVAHLESTAGRLLQLVRDRRCLEAAGVALYEVTDRNDVQTTALLKEIEEALR